MQTQQDNPVTIAVGFHVFPSRTQQLSPHTPKVLGWKRPGRIGSCRLRKSSICESRCCFFLTGNYPSLSKAAQRPATRLDGVSVLSAMDGKAKDGRDR